MLPFIFLPDLSLVASVSKGKINNKVEMGQLCLTPHCTLKMLPVELLFNNVESVLLNNCFT